MTSKHEYPLKDYLNSINLKTMDMSEDERAMKKAAEEKAAAEPYARPKEPG